MAIACGTEQAEQLAGGDLHAVPLWCEPLQIEFIAPVGSCFGPSGRFVPEPWRLVSRGVRELRLELADAVLEEIVRRHAVPMSGVRSSSRMPDLVACRTDAAFALRRCLDVPAAKIAAVLRPVRRGRTAHSTVFEMVKRVERSGRADECMTRAAAAMRAAGDAWFRERSSTPRVVGGAS